jgi:cytochrome c oxidase subunit 4
MASHAPAEPLDPHLVSGHAGDHNPIAHVMPKWMLIAVFTALLALTAATVYFAGFELGSYEILVAMTIATIKAVLVATFFMHLKYDNPLNAAILLFSLIFVGLFLGLTVLDTQSYRGDVDEWRANQAAEAAG